MQFRRVIDYFEGICILHNDPGIAQNLEITEQKSELTITNLTTQCLFSATKAWHLEVTKEKRLIYNAVSRLKIGEDLWNVELE